MKKTILLCACLFTFYSQSNAQSGLFNNLDPINFLQKKTPSITVAGTANGFSNGYTFAYATSGAPWNGALMSFGGITNGHDCQFSSDYGPDGGKHLSFRTHNGDGNINAWNPWNEIWHSGNLTPSNLMQRKVTSIKNVGSVNDFSNGYTFAYATSGTPWNGALMSFGGFTGRYDCQFNADYGANGGAHLSFRTQNGDNNALIWNPWNELYHSGNINNDDVNFKCKNLLANGNLWAKEIIVASANPWPDYVFEPSHEKLSLTELEIFVKTNKHLPEIPTAKVIEKEGINVGDMNAKLLKKIEELTLYVIELKHEVDDLKKENKLK